MSDEAYLKFAEVSQWPSSFTDCSFVHPRTWLKLGIRHAADTSEQPRPGALGQFFVIAPCHEYSMLHRALKEDVGPVTCLLCIMIMTEPR